MIFLKRLELQGFKSFAGKTVLEFPSRVTAIVGPNGSGKSNIMDALRWVLGEREAKHLRGEKLENLIFSGSPKRPPAGLARVTLYFDNQTRYFSTAETEEVTLSRRIDRSGVSKFFWHNQEIKLKDLTEILAKAKLGSRGLTMIGQGESDIFVRSSLEERRAMIEEVLGLQEFRLKKNQAEKRLAASEINLEKVKAMLEELTPHLRFLRRQKNRWEKRQQLEDELYKLENAYFSFHYSVIQRELKSIEASIEQATEQFKRKREEVEKINKDFQKIYQVNDRAAAINRLRKEINEWSAKKTELTKEAARLEVRLEMAKNREQTIDIKQTVDFLHYLKEELEYFLKTADWQLVKAGLEQILEHLKKLLHFETEDERINSFEEEQRRINSEIEKINAILSELNKQEENLLAAEEENRQNLKFLLSALEEAKSALVQTEAEKQKLDFERERLKLRQSDLVKQFESFGRSLNSLPKEAEINDSTSLDWPAIERRILKLRGELAAIGEIDQSLVQEAEETEKRYAFLSQELTDLEKASADLKKMIKELENKIHEDFKRSFRLINEAFNNYFRLMFGGGRARLVLVKSESQVLSEEMPIENISNEQPTSSIRRESASTDLTAGIDIELNLPKKKITNLEVLSGGEKSLVSIAVLFALISVSPPPFLVLDEIDATLDENNARRFAELVREFSDKSQFLIITHNRATMEVADVLYGVTMGDDGVSKIISLKLENET